MINQENGAESKPRNTPRLPSPATPRLRIGSARKELGIFVLLVLLCIVVAIKNPAFLGADNLQNLARLVGIYGIFGIGAGIVIITGGIELTVGSVFALEGVLLAIMLTQSHVNPFLAVIISIAVTMLIGWINGWLITRVPLQPFIVTLCGLLFYRGLARFIAHDNTEGFGAGNTFDGLMTLATGKLFGVPAPFIVMIVVAVIMWMILHRSLYGRYLYAVGRNEEAARYSGINSQRIITSAYVVAGALTGISGILLAFYTNSISPSMHGQSYELYGIAAAVLGGCSLRGGEGSIIGILIGTALLQVLENLVNLLGIDSSLNFAVIGAVILLGVIVDEVVKKRSVKKIRA